MPVINIIKINNWSLQKDHRATFPKARKKEIDTKEVLTFTDYFYISHIKHDQFILYINNTGYLYYCLKLKVKYQVSE
jgi:hypothetical protein